MTESHRLPRTVLLSQRHDAFDAAMGRTTGRIRLVTQFADSQALTKAIPGRLKIPRAFEQAHVAEMTLEHVARAGNPVAAMSQAFMAPRLLKPICIGRTMLPSTCDCIVPLVWPY